MQTPHDKGKPGEGLSAFLASDAPLSDPSQDRLGMRPLAEQLARSIASINHSDSMVIGICGKWGCGKTSLLAMTTRSLESQADPPLIVRFNPWWFSRGGDLLSAFLSSFASALGQKDSTGAIAKISTAINALAQILRPITTFVPGAEIPRKLIEDAAQTVSHAATDRKQDVDSLRATIDTCLREQSRVMILMDDIDRLTPSEVAQLFQIVKAVGNFPNTTYILAFDHSYVAKALSTTLNVQGESYLEKIIQLRVDVPSRPALLENYLLDQIVQTGLLDLALDDHLRDFGNSFHKGLKYLLTTPRAVQRFLSCLRYAQKHLAGEVYPPDLVSIVGLQTAAPTAFAVLRRHPEMFIETDDRNKRDAAQFHTRWLKRIRPASSRLPIRNLLEGVFPKLRSMGYGGGFRTRWSHQRRICSEENFEKYLFLTPQPFGLSDAEFVRIINKLDEGDKVDREIMKLCDEKGRECRSTQMKEFLTRVARFAEHDATPRQARLLFLALMRMGDSIASTEDAEVVVVMPVKNELRLTWALQPALRASGDIAERDHATLEAFSEKTSIATKAGFIRVLGYAHGRFTKEPPKPEEAFVTMECHDRLMEMTCTRLREMAHAGILGNAPRWWELYWDWRSLGCEEEADDWITRYAEGDEGFLKVLDAYCRRLRSHGVDDCVATQVLEFDVDSFVRLFNLERALERVRTLQPGFSKEQRAVADCFRAAIEKQTTQQKEGTPGGPDEPHVPRPTAQE